MKSLTSRSAVRVAFAILTIFITSAFASAQLKVNGSRAVEKSVYDAALKDRKVASSEEAKTFNALFNPKDIFQAMYDDLTKVTILWQPRSAPKPACMKDAIIQVQTLDGAGQVVGTVYSKVEVPYPDGKGMIFPFDNRADTGKSIRITILPADAKTIITVTLEISRT